MVGCLQIADEGFDGVHQEDVLEGNLGKDKVMGRLSEEDAAKGKAVIAYTPPPLDSVLNLYDLEAIAQRSMKDTSWGYYFTGATDEYTKCGAAFVLAAVLAAAIAAVSVAAILAASLALSLSGIVLDGGLLLRKHRGLAGWRCNM